MAYVWHIDGICMEYVQNRIGMEYCWNMSAILVECVWNECEYVWNVWNMDGVWMESVWNRYGMNMYEICITVMNLDGTCLEY